MEEVDPQHKIKIAVDEWGAICAKGTEVSAANYWSRAVTLRDVVGAALTLDTLNRHADKVMVACFTGLINQEGGLFIAEGDKFVASGIYHVFQLYAAHQGGRLVRTEFDAPLLSYGKEGRRTLGGLNGSASRKDKILTLTVVNPHACQARETEINLRGGRIKQTRHEVITHQNIQAQNTFEDPNQLRAIEMPMAGRGSSLTCTFPPASVNKLTIGLI